MVPASKGVDELLRDTAGMGLANRGYGGGNINGNWQVCPNALFIAIFGLLHSSSSPFPTVRFNGDALEEMRDLEHSGAYEQNTTPPTESMTSLQEEHFPVACMKRGELYRWREEAVECACCIE